MEKISRHNIDNVEYRKSANAYDILAMLAAHTPLRGGLSIGCVPVPGPNIHDIIFFEVS